MEVLTLVQFLSVYQAQWVTDPLVAKETGRAYDFQASYWIAFLFVYLLFTCLFTDDAEPHRGRGVDGHLPGRVVREQQLPAQTPAQTQDQQGAWSRQTGRRSAARVRIHDV